MEFKSSAPIFGPISDPHILINNTQLHTIHAKSLKWVSKNKVKLQSWITTMTPSHHQRKKLTFTSLLIVLTNQPNKQTKARIQIEDTNHRNRNEKELSNTCTRKATWNWDWKSKRVLEERNLKLRGIRRLWHAGVKLLSKDLSCSLYHKNEWFHIKLSCNIIVLKVLYLSIFYKDSQILKKNYLFNF